jgi:SAM-dependent methyltransferase/uncharacterized protein YbaR (Trm112 family)
MTSPVVGTGAPRRFLDLLHCPYCGLPLRTESNGADAANVRYGLLRCACCEYPVVEGIPIVQQIDGLQRVTQHIRSGDLRLALLLALDLFRVQWAQRSRLHRLRYHWNSRRLIEQSDLHFEQAAQWVRRPDVFADYLVHRYANPSFLAAIGPLIVLARSVGRPARVLDLACGAGHASHVMQLLDPSLEVVSADQDFVNLYLARRWLATDGLHLCIDAQVPSPFPDTTFDAVYCQDAFHYVASKKAAVEELKRVARPDALWVFPHLHNRLCHNLVAGIPLSPQDYLRCFDLRGARLFAESELLRGLVEERAIDLRSAAPVATLEAAPTLTMIRGGDEVWRRFVDFPSALCRDASALQLNPIYRVHPDGDGVRLERRWPNPVMARECAEAEAVLPALCRLDGAQWSQWQAGLGATPPSWVEDLVARFVVVALPRRYAAAAGPR